MSQAYGTPPSSLFNVSHPVSAYWFDRAIHSLGSTIEAEIEAATENAKSTKQAHAASQTVMNKWLRVEGKGRYKDPAKGR